MQQLVGARLALVVPVPVGPQTALQDARSTPIGPSRRELATGPGDQDHGPRATRLVRV